MPDLIDQIQRLTADEIAERLERLADDERTLRTLLRSARAKERATRQKQVAFASRKDGRHE